MNARLASPILPAAPDTARLGAWMLGTADQIDTALGLAADHAGSPELAQSLRRARRAFSQVDSGRPPIDDRAAIVEICGMIADGVKPQRALNLVARRVGRHGGVRAATRRLRKKLPREITDPK